MVIIAGMIYIEARLRDRHVASMAEFVRDTRTKPGCLDFAMSADPVEPGRVNLYERWDSEEQLEAFRATAAPPEAVAEILAEDVMKFQIGSFGPAFD